MNRWVVAAAMAVLSVGGAQVALASEVGAAVVFSDAEIQAISVWYREHGSRNDAKRGKGKRNGLPPGLSKNLARGKPLPPGIAKNYLPDGLRQALPPPPTGFERIIVDGKVLLVEIATQVVHDVLVDLVLD